MAAAGQAGGPAGLSGVGGPGARANALPRVTVAGGFETRPYTGPSRCHRAGEGMARHAPTRDGGTGTASGFHRNDEPRGAMLAV